MMVGALFSTIAHRLAEPSELSSDPKAVHWHNHRLRTTLEEVEQELPIALARQNNEALRGQPLVSNLAFHPFCPRPSVVYSHGVECSLVRLDHPVGVYQSMLSRKDVPRPTLVDDVRSRFLKPWRPVEHPSWTRVLILYRYAGDEVDVVGSVHGINPGNLPIKWRRSIMLCVWFVRSRNP
jgi:hypothetical protein